VAVLGLALGVVHVVVENRKGTEHCSSALLDIFGQTTVRKRLPKVVLEATIDVIPAGSRTHLLLAEISCHNIMKISTVPPICPSHTEL